MKSPQREPDLVVRNGKPVSVIIPIKEYADMVERLEDAEDVAYLTKTRTKPLSFRPLKDCLAELHKVRAKA
jgi:PHD/YefM family antitoxin component YafN of YafNO toxin-antitoxin module